MGGVLARGLNMSGTVIVDSSSRICDCGKNRSLSASYKREVLDPYTTSTCVNIGSFGSFSFSSCSLPLLLGFSTTRSGTNGGTDGWQDVILWDILI